MNRFLIDTVEPLSAEAFSRDTLVVEATFPEPIGSDASGARRVQRYLNELAEIVGASPLREPLAHLSQKYGFSGWAPLTGDKAIHLYAWDERDRPTAPFISVDVSTPGELVNSPEVIAHLRGFVGAAAETVVWKTLRNPYGRNAQTWRELAPHILRQRLAVAGSRKEIFGIGEIQAYLRGLCGVLNMDQLSEILITYNAGYVHWETSGTVASWRKGEFAADIYTCKKFDPADAISYTRRALGLSELISREF